MSKTARQAARLAPCCRATGTCGHATQTCGAEVVEAMPDAARIDGRRVVDYDINGAPILEGRALPLPRYDGGERQCCGALASGPLKPTANRPGAAARARLEATPEGRALLAAAKAHLLQCLQLTPEGIEAFTLPTAAAMAARPCRCGGCPGMPHG